MSNTPHELHEEFPDAGGRLAELKAADPRFARLIESYNAVNREVHRVETDIEPAADEVLEALKKRRLALKDEIAARLDPSTAS